MSVFTSIQDMSNSSLVLSTLREIGCYFYQACKTSGPLHEALTISQLAFPDESYKNAVSVLHPLAFFLQRKAPEEQKERLGEMLAADSEIIESLFEGILIPFVQETSVHQPREIRSASRLYLVRLVHVCLMELSENQAMKMKLIQSGCVYLLLKELRNMTRVIQGDPDTNKLSRELIQLAALIVSNCLSENVDLYMRLYPETDIAGAFMSYFKYPNPIVQLVCKLTYYQFSYYLYQSKPELIDNPEDVLYYARLLCTASESKQLVVMEANLCMDATDLLKVLQCLTVSESNRKTLFSSKYFPRAITNLLLSEGVKEIEFALCLLLTFLIEGQQNEVKGKKSQKKPSGLSEMRRKQVKEESLLHFPDIKDQLKCVLGQHGSVESIKKLCSTLLHCIQGNHDDDIQCLLEYVKCCYEYKGYEECCYWSDYIGKHCSNAEAKLLRDQFLLYKAKAKFHLYQTQVVVLRRSEALKTFGEIKQDRERVHDNTREVISILGSVKAKNLALFDSECEQLLDYALMDYIRELNKQPSSKSKGSGANEFYCMLCHKKLPIVRSHTIPEAVLKIVLKGDQQVVMTGPSRLSLESRVQTIHTQTFYMLCNTCDNEILSRDENLFVEKIVKPVYCTPVSHLQAFNMTYDRWLHRFCAGVVFRCLTLSRGITGSTNAEEIHKLFHYCRSVVKSPYESSSVASHADTFPSIGDDFCFAIFFTPGFVEDKAGVEKPSNFVRTLNSSVFQRLSNVPISGSYPSWAKNRHFFAVHFGIFTIVAFLEPVPLAYQKFLIDPVKGDLVVPANDERLSLIPPGLLKLYEEQTEESVKHHLERMVEIDQKVGKDLNFAVYKTNIDDQKPVDGPMSFNLLPPKFELNRKTNVLSMKEGHIILVHHTFQLPSASHTIFLAIDKKEPSKPYVIIHSCLETNPLVLQTFGYFISLPDYAFKKELDSSHKEMMRQIRAKDLDLFKCPAQVFPLAFERAGVQNYQSILFHLNRGSIFDRKCSINGCWYCSHLCDVCMLDSTPGFLSKDVEDSNRSIRFCGEKCKSFHSSVFQPSFSVLRPPSHDITFTLISDNMDDGVHEVQSVHIQSVVFSSSGERNQCPPIHASVDVYKVKKGLDCLPSGYSIVLFDLRTSNSQIFGEYFLTDEFQLEKPLAHVEMIEIDKKQQQLLNDVLHASVTQEVILPE